jgi:glycosyltransferase involved in cell wall biosynthesis
MGRPIMVNDVDETADFVRQYGCGFVSSPQPEAMAKTMLRAARTPAAVLAQMGAAARKMAEEHFSWQKIGDDYHKVILRLIAGNRKRGGK